MRLSILLLSIGVIALALTNPTLGDFESFARSHSEAMITEETGNSALGRALAGAGASIVESYIRRTADREDFIIYSIYSVRLNEGQEEWKFLGIGGQFIELERPESFQER